MKLCFDTSIRDAGIRTLIEDGYLSKTRHFTIPVYTPETATEFYLRERERWGKTVLYFHTIPQCESAVARLRNAGVRVKLVTAAGDHDSQLERFENGELDVLVNCFVLAEGFDCPFTDRLLPTERKGAVTVQMCGRVLRKHARTPMEKDCPVPEVTLAVSPHRISGTAISLGTDGGAYSEPPHSTGRHENDAGTGPDSCRTASLLNEAATQATPNA